MAERTYTRQVIECAAPISEEIAQDQTQWPVVFGILRADLDAQAARAYPGCPIVEYRLDLPRWGSVEHIGWWMGASARVLVPHTPGAAEGE